MLVGDLPQALDLCKNYRGYADGVRLKYVFSFFKKMKKANFLPNKKCGAERFTYDVPVMYLFIKIDLCYDYNGIRKVILKNIFLEIFNASDRVLFLFFKKM